MKIEGRNSVRELLKTDKTVDKLLVQNGLRDEEAKRLISEAKSSGIKIHFADKAVLDKECARHQGFIAFTTDYSYADFDDILKKIRDKEDAFIVVLDGVEDPHNLGSIIRVLECAGADGLVIGKHRSAGVTDSVMRISEGGANHIDIAKVVNINTAIERIKEENIWVYALEADGSQIYKADLKGRLCLVVGGEDSGVNALTKRKCDGVLSIPMYGKINSLNASVATGVAVFEALRQRKS